MKSNPLELTDLADKLRKIFEKLSTSLTPEVIVNGSDVWFGLYRLSRIAFHWTLFYDGQFRCALHSEIPDTAEMAAKAWLIDVFDKVVKS